MKNHHAVTLGKKGGQIGGRSRSPAKIATAKANGKKGGRPKKEARTLERELTTLTIERDQLRAEVKRWQAEAEEMSVQRSHNANQAGRLRAELAVAENWVEHHSKHADDLIGENVSLRAEVERLKGALALGQENCDFIYNDMREERTELTARAERAEADTARLNWLAVSDVWFDFPATGAFTPETMRAAIDAAMKGTP